VNHWGILSYFLFTPLFLLISIALTIINTFSACLFDFREGRIHPGTFGWALTSPCFGHSGSWCSCPTVYLIQRLLRNRPHCHLDYLSPHSSPANRHCPKYFQVRYPHHFRLDDSWFFRFGGQLIFEFGLQGSPLQTQVVAKEIILTIEMQPLHHGKTVTTMLWQSLPYLKCIPRQWYGCFAGKIPPG